MIPLYGQVLRHMQRHICKGGEEYISRVRTLLRSNSFYADLFMLFPITSFNRAVSHGLTPGMFQQAFPTMIRLALYHKIYTL